MSIKNIIKKIVPVTYGKIEMSTEQLLAELREQTKLLNDLEKRVECLQQENTEFRKTLNRVKVLCESEDKYVWKIKNIDKECRLTNDILRLLDDKIMNNHNSLNSRMANDNSLTGSRLVTLDDKVNKISKLLSDTGNETSQAKRQAAETVWSCVWHDTVVDSEWLLDKKFSPGRWAVGYQYLYALYRVLNEYRPENILELGLGQSTKMIGQYAEYNKETNHIVVEHDAGWEEFYKNNNAMCERTTVMHMDLKYEKFMDAEDIAFYDGFETKLKDMKFDFISIDAPFGSGHQEYARVDTLKIIPQCLAERFVIMIDDYNRLGEQAMVELMKSKLENSGISYCCGKYSGEKDTYIIVSEDYKFLCSM